MGASSGSPPPRCAGLGCSPTQEGHRRPAARSPARRAGGSHLASHPAHRWQRLRPLRCSVRARGTAATGQGRICGTLRCRATLRKAGSACTGGSAKRNYAISPGCAPATAWTPGTARATPGARSARSGTARPRGTEP